MKKTFLAGVSAAALVLTASAAYADFDNNAATSNNSGNASVNTDVNEGLLQINGNASLTNSGNQTDNETNSNNVTKNNSNQDNINVNNTQSGANLSKNQSNTGQIGANNNINSNNEVTTNTTGTSATEEANDNGSYNTVEKNSIKTDAAITYKTNAAVNNTADNTKNYDNTADFSNTGDVTGAVLGANVAKTTFNFQPGAGVISQGNLMSKSYNEGSGIASGNFVSSSAVNSVTNTSVAVSVGSVN